MKKRSSIIKVVALCLLGSACASNETSISNFKFVSEHDESAAELLPSSFLRGSQQHEHQKQRPVESLPGIVQHVDEQNGNGRNLSIWTVFLNHLHGCPPGPIGNKCRAKHDSDGSSGGDGGSDGSSGSGGSSSSSSSSNGGDDSSSSSGGGGSNHKGPIGAFLSSPAGKVTLITIAAAAASVAIAAMYMANKNRGGDKKHPLKGILKKRIGLFSRMAERSACTTCRPERVICQVDDSSTDYQLA